jgi:AcrR family transcriptional regulator
MASGPDAQAGPHAAGPHRLGAQPAGPRAAFELLWGQRSAGKRGPRPTLSAAEIARAGIAVADADGLGAVTMQRVADDLGVTKMALYRYVPGKVELVALMIDTGMGEPPRLAEVAGGWRPRLRAWALGLFELFQRHPWTLETTVGVRVMGPNEVGWLEEAVAALAGTSLNGAQMLDVVVMLVGHARNLAQQTATPGGGSTEQAMGEAIAALVRGREDRFPALARALRSAAASGAQDQALEFGFDRILDGVELLIASRA